MAKGYEVLRMLIPTGGWAIQGNDFDSIVYDEGVKALTKAQFNAGLADYDAWVLEQESIKAIAKTELLAKLGITNNEAKLLLS
jgi:hypothetical protein